MQDRILAIAARVLKSSPDALELDTPRSAVKGWDSFAHIALVSTLEEELDLIVPMEDVPEITRLSQFLKYTEDGR